MKRRHNAAELEAIEKADAIDRQHLEVAKLNTFVQMTVKDGSARFLGRYDVFVCRWEDVASMLKDFLEDDAAAAGCTVAFEFIESELDFEEWCEENGVEYT